MEQRGNLIVHARSKNRPNPQHNLLQLRRLRTGMSQNSFNQTLMVGVRELFVAANMIILMQWHRIVGMIPISCPG